MATLQGNREGNVTNPGIDEVIRATPALDKGTYFIAFSGSSDNGAGETAFQLLRDSNNVVLRQFKEQVGGLVNWAFEASVKQGDVFQVVSKTADARKVFGAITWLQKSPTTAS